MLLLDMNNNTVVNETEAAFNARWDAFVSAHSVAVEVVKMSESEYDAEYGTDSILQSWAGGGEADSRAFNLAHFGGRL